jgi:hypothetical protein
MTKTELPPLPECDSYCTHADDHLYDVFTAEQMHAYARAALAPLEAELERMRMDAARLREALESLLRFAGCSGGDDSHLEVQQARAAIDSAMNPKGADKQPAAPKREKTSEAAARSFLADYIAERQAWIDKGKCPDCHGEGTVGGQFSGGYQTCETCGGSGAARATGAHHE